MNVSEISEKEPFTVLEAKKLKETKMLHILIVLGLLSNGFALFGFIYVIIMEHKTGNVLTNIVASSFAPLTVGMVLAVRIKNKRKEIREIDIQIQKLKQ